MARERGGLGTKAAVVMSALALLFSLTGVAAGTGLGDLFNDIATAGFRTPINRIGRAGCASGFSDGSFRPQASTTRGQFAFWTNNCGARAGFDFGSVTQTEPGGAELLRVGLVGGGAATAGSEGGFVIVSASVSARVDGEDAALCPCTIDASVFDVNNNDNSGIALGTLASPDSDDVAQDNLAITAMFPLEAATAGEYVLNVDYSDDQAPDIDWTGDMSVVWVPFGADGDRAFEVDLD